MGMGAKQITLISFILIFISSLTTACSNESSIGKNQGMPSDFNFSLIYGTYGKQEIDTFNDIVIKDLVLDGTVEAEIPFTEFEMKEIYNKMIHIDIMGELDLEKEKQCEMEPESISIWKIQMNGKTKNYSLKTYCDYPEDVHKLMDLEDYIHNLMANKKEYKMLPESNGFYE